MQLHVLTGCRDLLRPERLRGEQLAELIGPKVRAATAFWISARCGSLDHDFLFDAVKDRRVEVFAQALRDNFGARFEPLIILPDLLCSVGAASQAHPQAALAALRELWRHRPAESMIFHGVALPEGIDGGDGWARESEILAPSTQDRLEALRAAFLAGEEDAILGIAVIEVRPDQPHFAVLLRNAVAQRIAARADRRLTAEGLQALPANLPGAAARVLAAWHRSGMAPAQPLDLRSLDRLSERVVGTLLTGGPCGD